MTSFNGYLKNDIEAFLDKNRGDSGAYRGNDHDDDDDDTVTDGLIDKRNSLALDSRPGKETFFWH
jgi:hypothetical protein